MDNKIYTLIPTNSEEKSNKIDLIKILTKVWIKRKFIMIFTGIFVFIGFFVAIISPVSYTTSSTVVPQMGSKGSGGSLGGLASIMGVNIGSSTSGEILSPYVYPQIINSVPFCKEIMETPIVVEKSNGELITLYDYYTDNQYSSTNVLGVIKKYTVGLPGVILSALKSDSELATTVTDEFSGDVIRLSKEERSVIEAIQGNVQFDSNDKEGYIKLGYTFSEPQPTAVIAQNMYVTLEKYVTNYKSQKQLDNLVFVEESYERARKDFMEKQAALASFQDANRDLTSAMARTTERSLTNEYQVAYTVYNELAVQLEQAKISVKESTPILTVINPVVVPHKKSNPGKLSILIGFLFMGLAVSIGWVLVKPLLQELVRDLKKNDTEVEID